MVSRGDTKKPYTKKKKYWDSKGAKGALPDYMGIKGGKKILITVRWGDRKHLKVRLQEKTEKWGTESEFSINQEKEWERYYKRERAAGMSQSGEKLIWARVCDLKTKG